MSLEELPQDPMPLWVKIAVVVCTLPVLALPWLWAGNPGTEEGRVLLWLYPAVVLIFAVCAWKAWRSGPTLTYILLAMMLLTHAAMWLLCYPSA